MNEDSKSKVEFKPPSDFQPPENIEMGKDWDVVCSFRTKPDGMICMTKLGDSDMPGYGEHEGQEHKPDYSEVSKPIMDAAPSPQPQQSY